MGICLVNGCDRPSRGKQLYCKGHQARVRRTGEPGLPFEPKLSWAGRETCRVDGCRRRAYVKREQLCSAHYTRLHKYGDVRAFKARRQAETCAVEGCEASPSGTGGSLDMCKHHYAQHRGPDAQRLRSRIWMLRSYGLSLEEYEDLLRSQDHRCGICGSPDPRRKNGETGNWCVDHDHRTGRVRGLLCHPCNRGIGALGDNIQILKAAVAYLEGQASAERDLRKVSQEEALQLAAEAAQVIQQSLRTMGARVRAR